MLRVIRICAAMALFAGVAVFVAWPAHARIQDGSADICWSPDNEFPVPCDEDEE